MATSGQGRPDSYPQSKKEGNKLTVNYYTKHTVELLRKNVQKLDRELKQAGSDPGRQPQSFDNWCAAAARDSYPGIGRKALVVPHIFIAKRKTESFTLPSPPSHLPRQLPIAKRKTESFTLPSPPSHLPRQLPIEEAPETTSGSPIPGAEDPSDINEASVPPEPRTDVHPHRLSPGKTDTDLCDSHLRRPQTNPKRKTDKSNKRDGIVFLVDQSTSDIRGQSALRLVWRTLTIQNSKLEAEAAEAMFIICELHYDNVLSVIRKPKCLQRYITNWVEQFPNVFAASEECQFFNIKALDDAIGGKQKPQPNKSRGELDLMVLHEEKGVLLFQVKAISLYKPSDSDLTQEPGSEREENSPDIVRKRIKSIQEQLDTDDEVLELVMGTSSRWSRWKTSGSRVTKVIALPNMTRGDLKRYDMKEDEGYKYLYEEDLISKTLPEMEVAECETNTDNFLQWWNSLPSQNNMDETLMEEIIGKLIGPLSVVLEPKEGNFRERVYRFRDCVKYTGCHIKDMLISARQRKHLESSAGKKRVYISGPPGSGKTVLMVLKANSFLEESADHVVLVVNMYRGAEGRCIGRKIGKMFRQNESAQSRVFVIDVDVGGGNFFEKVKDVFKLRAADWKKVLFLVDEVYVESFWREILDEFIVGDEIQAAEEAGLHLTTGRGGMTAQGCGEGAGGELPDKGREASRLPKQTKGPGPFADSYVWCAGLFSDTPTGFWELEMDTVLRCPPAVQHLLYNVDWKEIRKTKYRRDTQWQEISTNGPIPLCVRHGLHKARGQPVIDCHQCGEELALILIQEAIVRPQPVATKHLSDPGTSTTNTPTDSSDTELNVVILVNMPRKLYQRTPQDFIEATIEDYAEYMLQISSSRFVQVLKDNGITVTVSDQLGCKNLEDVTPGADVMATWLYNFQGLESEVVIFLPGDLGPEQRGGEDDLAREIPVPGLGRKREDVGNKVDQKEVEGRAAQGSTCTASARSDTPPQLISETPTTESTPVAMRGCSTQNTAVGASSYSLTGLQWKKGDMERFSSWDRTNILVAGSRTLSLLVLIVP